MKGMKRRLAALLAVALTASAISFPGYAEPIDDFEYEDVELGNGTSRMTRGDTTFETNVGEFDGSTLTLTVGEKASVTIATPADAEIATASSSNAEKVSVSVASDSNAVEVTANKTTGNTPVTVTVTYEATDSASPANYTAGKQTATFSVIVKEEVIEEEPAIQLILEKKILDAGESTILTVNLIHSDGYLTVVTPTATASNAVSIESMNDGKRYKVTAKSVAQDTDVTIAVNATVDDGTSVSAETVLTVLAGKPADTTVKSIELSADRNSVYTHQTVLATAKINPADAKDTIKFLSSDDSVLKQSTETVVSDGIATAEFIAMKAGRANISAIAENSKVTSNVEMISVKNISANISFAEKAVSMKPGTEKTIAIDSVTLDGIEDANLLELVKEGIVYSSSDSSIVTVDAATGEVKAIKDGMATLRAESKYAIGEATCTIIVAKDAVHQIVVKNADVFSKLDTGLIKKINYTLYEVKEDGTMTDVTKEYTASWKSSKPSVVPVDTKGVISTLAEGTAEITITVADAAGKVLAVQTLKVQVEKVKPLPEEDATAYKNNADVAKALSGESVTKEEVESAGLAIGGTIEAMDMGALLKSGALSTVMKDIGTIEQLLKSNGVTTENKPAVTTTKIKGTVEVSGLMLNGYLNASPAPTLSVGDAPAGIVIPEKVLNKQVEESVAIDISADTDISTPVTIKLPAPAGYTTKNTMLLHYEDGDPDSATIVPCSIVDGKLVFTVGSFSPFVLVRTKTDSNGGNNSSGGSSVSTTRVSEAGKWIQNETGWWYRYQDGTWPANRWVSLSYAGASNWYHFDQNGYMQSGWYQDTDGRKYYLNSVSNGTRGAMLTGWQMIDGNWYYFNTVSDNFKGSLFVNTTTPDNHKVDNNGVWVK